MENGARAVRVAVTKKKYAGGVQSMDSIRLVNPFRCRMWGMHDRLEQHISEQTCASEIESFAKHGQLVPALGRPLRGDPDYDVELVYGARRLFVARHINKPLAVELRDMSDRECIIAMDIENRQRVDISPYERGISFLQWLRSGHFRSQDDLAKALNISPSVVSRLIKVSRLPAVIVDAFGDPTTICETWALSLTQALEDPRSRQSTVARARAIAAAAPRPSPQLVYTQLLANSAKGNKLRAKSRDEVVKNPDDDAPLFRIRQQRSSIALVLPLERVSTEVLQRIRESIVGILRTASVQRVDPAVVAPRKAQPKAVDVPLATAAGG
jgi:ParB/RepB/Spo0J family partition protein